MKGSSQTITKDYFDTKLSSFVTKDYLDQKLSEFVTKGYLDQRLSELKVDIKEGMRDEMIINNEKLEDKWRLIKIRI